MVLRLPDSWSNWNWKCWFLRRGENQSMRRTTSRSRERTNNKVNPHMESKPGFALGPHWWEASRKDAWLKAFTGNLHSQISTRFITYTYLYDRINHHQTIGYLWWKETLYLCPCDSSPCPYSFVCNITKSKNQLV